MVFRKNSIELDYIKEYIKSLDAEINLFYKVAFSQTVRKVSLTRNGEFKLYRIPKNKIPFHNPDSFQIMKSILLNNIELIKKTKPYLNYNTLVNIFFDNSINIISNIDYTNRFDLVITSPPYGDSRTTVAYGQFSRLANEWLDFENPNQIDNKLMGGLSIVDTSIVYQIDELNNIINEIKKRDQIYSSKRTKDVISFYNDYLKSIESVSSTVKKGGYAIYVVGNRRVRDIEIPMDIITAKAFEHHGFYHIETIVRDIINKRMPSKTSPDNKEGSKVATMSQEYIVVMKKEF